MLYKAPMKYKIGDILLKHPFIAIICDIKTYGRGKKQRNYYKLFWADELGVVEDYPISDLEILENLSL